MYCCTCTLVLVAHSLRFTCYSQFYSCLHSYSYSGRAAVCTCVGLCAFWRLSSACKPVCDLDVLDAFLLRVQVLLGSGTWCFTTTKKWHDERVEIHTRLFTFFNQRRQEKAKNAIFSLWSQNNLIIIHNSKLRYGIIASSLHVTIWGFKLCWHL